MTIGSSLFEQITFASNTKDVPGIMLGVAFMEDDFSDRLAFMLAWVCDSNVQYFDSASFCPSSTESNILWVESE